MRISCNFCQPSNTLLNAGSVNRSINKNNTNIGRSSSNNANAYRVSISSEGNLWNMVQNLTKQKEEIIERKSELVNTTFENGGDMDSIKAQLDLYTEQIKNIDKQISDLYAQQAKDVIKQNDEKITNKSNKNKTEEQIETENLISLTNLSDSIKQAEKISSAKNRIDGEVRVKESEVNMGELHIDILVSKNLGGGATVEDMISNAKNTLDEKRDLISDLKENASSLDFSQGESLNNTINKLAKNKKTDEECERFYETNTFRQDTVSKLKE